MMEAKELDKKCHAQIVALCEAGDAFAEKDEFEKALDQYNKAFDLVPEPKNEWGASTWILTAIGDVCFLNDDTLGALKALRYAMACPDAIGNPFLHLRYGQVLYDLEEHDRAADELMRAYMGAGVEIFEGEDPYYLEFLKKHAKI